MKSCCRALMAFVFACGLLPGRLLSAATTSPQEELAANFQDPPDAARPGVY